ncbi:tyrosine-type recombinase/integrase [Pontiella sulfatireligans]|uniref:Tyrosine recombinase XerC n=1 Tax=Pontiella sulfatireligans TaxID=2750658 RepID=A0A6C2UV39_9BACT|nr:site-specific integrase [Pontiella sulfatireligans]VGO22716.1 hypothetical protein SCARR_04812 [Pontiella sulfatireligans]
MKKTNGKRDYTERGNGRLYIRTKDGKEHKPGSGFKGIYYLEYRRPGTDPKTGAPITKRVKERLVYGDGDQGHEKGDPIKSQADALKAQARIVNQYLTGNKADKLRNLKAELEAAEKKHAEAVEDANPPLSIADAWKAYDESSERPDTGEETLRRYQGHWLEFKKWIEKRNPDARYLRDIAGKDAQAYASHLNKTKASPNTFNKHTCFLRLFFKTLAEPARLTGNPFGKIKSKKLKPQGRRELSIEELHTILDTATGELKTLLYIGTFTGLRLGDCTTLKWGEVDLIRGIIRRVPSKTKGHDAKPVTIGIPAALHGILSETPKSRRKGYVAPKYAELYTHENAEGKRIRQSDITREVQTHFRKQGINTHKAGTGSQIKPNPEKPGEYLEEQTGKRAVVEVGFHSLRHTYVSIQAESGTPQAVVQAIVGHGNPAMTAHYTHIGEAAAKQAALAMPSRITDAEFEVLPDPVPAWVKELAATMTADNWQDIQAELMK